MLKIRQLQKEKQKSQEGSGHVVNKASPAEIRIGKDLEELVLPPTIKVEHSPNDIKNLKVTIRPDEGYYTGGVFKFECSINENYPMEAPKMKCLNKIYHPNIDVEGNVCLNILREDWTPVISLQTVFFGLQFLFLEPNETDPLNKEAAIELNKDRKKFARNVMVSMRGGYVNGEYYDNVYS